MMVILGDCLIYQSNTEPLTLLTCRWRIRLFIAGIYCWPACTGFGNGIEKVWWRFCGGMPTDWLRTGKRHLIADAQRNQVQVHLSQMLKKSGFELSNSIDSKQWYSITRQIYAVVSAAKRSARVDTFNGNYGLCRGIIASVFVLLIFVGFVRFCEWRTELALFVIFALALYRMHHFGVLYARELFVQFIAINLVDDMQSGGKGGNEK